MKILHNPEVRHFVLIIFFITVLLSITVFFLNPLSSFIILIMGILFLIFFLVFETKRYKRISLLSDELDAVLNEGKDFTITDMKEGDLSLLQNEIAKTTQQLKTQAEHLKADKQFMAKTMADISHQLRTPLTSIRLNLALLKDPGVTREHQKQLLIEMSSSLSRMERLIEELLKLSRLDAGAAIMKREHLSVQSLINTSIDTLAIPLDVKNVQVNFTDNHAFLYCDKYWTNEAFTNIIKNCMEHVHENGIITIIAEENPLSTNIIIKDNGEGFSQEDLPHIFERFYKGKNASPFSIGIGLALARTIIHEQDGTIQASNNKEGGACFTIHFYKQII